MFYILCCLPITNHNKASFHHKELVLSLSICILFIIIVDSYVKPEIMNHKTFLALTMFKFHDSIALIFLLKWKYTSMKK